MPNQRLFDANKPRAPKEFPIERIKIQNETITLIHTAWEKSSYKIEVIQNGKLQRSIDIDCASIASAFSVGQPFLPNLLKSHGEQALANMASNHSGEPIPAIVESLRTDHCSVALLLNDHPERPDSCDFELTLKMMSDTAMPNQMSSPVSNAAVAEGTRKNLRPLISALIFSPTIWNHILNNDPMLLSEREKSNIAAELRSPANGKPKPSKSI